MSYVVANRVFVKAGFEAEFEQRFQRRRGQIDKQPGFQQMQILQPQSEDTPYVVLTHWEGEEDFKNWVGSEDFRIAHQNPMSRDAFLPGGGLEQYQVVIDVVV